MSDGYTRKQFTPEFKREAVQLLENGSQPGTEITRDLGIARNQLYKWQAELRARGSGAFPSSGMRKERTTEIARLKWELACVTEERDILKKRQRTSPRMCGEVHVHAGPSPGVLPDAYVLGVASESQRVLWLASVRAECPKAGELPAR